MLTLYLEEKTMVKWILLIVLIALVVWIIAAYNGLVKLKNKCEESFSTMDVYLKKRYDMIPNLVETEGICRP